MKVINDYVGGRKQSVNHVRCGAYPLAAIASRNTKRSKTGSAANYGARNLAFIGIFGPAPRLVDQDALVARHARVVGAGRNGPNGTALARMAAATPIVSACFDADARVLNPVIC